MNTPALWQRRARPLLGTLVELGTQGSAAQVHAGFQAGFDAIHRVQACLSRFEPGSAISRFNALNKADGITLEEPGHRLMLAAQALRNASDGVFDVALGSGTWWVHQGHLHKAHGPTRLDLGGLAKGYAVDQAVCAMQRAGCSSGWVNAGGDLRVFGQAQAPVMLRDETSGGVRHLGELSHGALATSHFSANARSSLFVAAPGASSEVVPTCHVSVVAPRCLWADALTKIVAATGNPAHPLLARLGARAWLH